MPLSRFESGAPDHCIDCRLRTIGPDHTMRCEAHEGAYNVQYAPFTCLDHGKCRSKNLALRRTWSGSAPFSRARFKTQGWQILCEYVLGTAMRHPRFSRENGINRHFGATA
ncbi:hypothetical protein D3C77_291340 [compost metagenome]